MKNHISCLAILSFAAVIMLFVAPLNRAQASSHKGTSMEEVKKETGELAGTLKSYSVKQRDKAIEVTRDALEDLDGRIEALEARIDGKWDKMDQAARRETRESMKALRKQRNKVAEWYGSMKNGSAEAWDNMKEGFSGAYDELYEAWKKTEKEFSSDK